jgi:hypothetical protein
LLREDGCNESAGRQRSASVVAHGLLDTTAHQQPDGDKKMQRVCEGTAHDSDCFCMWWLVATLQGHENEVAALAQANWRSGKQQGRGAADCAARRASLARSAYR